MPPNPASPPASPKRYVHSRVEPVFTLHSCGNAAVSVVVNGTGLACRSEREGKWHRTACYRIVVLDSHEVACLPVAETSLEIPDSQQNFLVYMVLKSVSIFSLKFFASFLN